MSRVVVAYIKGRPVYRDDGPARGRCSGYGQGNTHDLTLIGGPIDTESERDRQLRMQRESMRKARQRA